MSSLAWTDHTGGNFILHRIHIHQQDLSCTFNKAEEVKMKDTGTQKQLWL